MLVAYMAGVVAAQLTSNLTSLVTPAELSMDSDPNMAAMPLLRFLIILWSQYTK